MELPRSICNDEHQAMRREWLVTNGLGGFASGTVSGILTRRYHGLLVAALHPPVGRTLLVSKVDETIDYAGRQVRLGANRWAGGVTDPDGFIHLESFRLEGSTPVWTYAVADALIEKRIWMQKGKSTTYVRYILLRGSAPVSISIQVLVNYRDFHGTTSARDWRMSVDPEPSGLRVEAFDGAIPFFLTSASATASPRNEWYRAFHLEAEAFRGLAHVEDHLLAGVFSAALKANQPLTLVFSSDPNADPDGDRSFADRLASDRIVLDQATMSGEPAEIRQMVLAADQFVVRRQAQDSGKHLLSVIAGYPWFADWGRDTMIALPGLILACGRHLDAADILRTFRQFVDRGMLPNRFPDTEGVPEYNTVDAALWFFEAVRVVLAASWDEALAQEFYPVFEDIVEHHIRGTRFGIAVDPKDGLLRVGEADSQLTWMDARVNGKAITPRIGKPVEVNALWYHALCFTSELARNLGRPSAEYDGLARRVLDSFDRFWCPDTGCCYDVVDGPEGDDVSLRPNQIFAVSLAHSPLTPARQKAVVDACSTHLLTPFGLRSLAPEHRSYRGRYGGPPSTRDAAYHQGTVWAWLLGPFVAAHLRVYNNPETARSFLLPLLGHINDHGLGSISEIFDAEPPFHPRGAIAQAWSVTEVLRAWMLTRSPSSEPSPTKDA